MFTSPFNNINSPSKDHETEFLDIVGQNGVIITQALNRMRKEKKEREICVNNSNNTSGNMGYKGGFIPAMIPAFFSNALKAMSL
jgi:hypothetical protein